MLGVKGHNAYFACTKCVTEGDFINNSCSLRTNSVFRNGQYDDYSLTELYINIVDQVPLDYMHLVCLGVMKRLLVFWLKGN